MPDDLPRWLASLTPAHHATLAWGGLPLALTIYLTDRRLPVAHITSARAVVWRDDQVLALRDADGGRHVTPGGRRQPGESLPMTLRREVREECGYALRAPRRLALLHFRHLEPRPPAYAYAYPSFLQVVYVAQAGRPLPGAGADEYVVSAEWLPLAQARRLPLSAWQRWLLDAAWARRAGLPLHTQNPIEEV